MRYMICQGGVQKQVVEKDNTAAMSVLADEWSASY